MPREESIFVIVEGEVGAKSERHSLILPYNWRITLVASLKQRIIDALRIQDAEPSTTSLVVHLSHGSFFQATKSLTALEAYICAGRTVTLKKNITPPPSPQCGYHGGEGDTGSSMGCHM